MRDIFTGRETQGKMESDQRKELHARQASDTANAAQKQNVYNQANSDFLRSEQQAQTQIRREQDQSLDKMSNSLDRLGQMARSIDVELAEQDKIITDIDKDIDVAQNKMDSAIKGVEKLLKTKDRCQLATIFTLTLIFVIVTIIAIS